MSLASQAADDVSERESWVLPGLLMLIVGLAALFAIGHSIFKDVSNYVQTVPVLRLLGVALILWALTRGLKVLEPKQAVVLTLFGRYAGTVRRAGFWWFNPFYARHNVSLRVVNLTTPTLKVNDSSGNPIEIAAVVVWCIEDTARAVFAVENYSGFIAQQAESALRQVASVHPYDSDDRSKSLRGNVDGVSEQLKDAIGSHVAIAGVEIVDARIAHLAYAPEIAGVMLRRQQAEAVLAARRIIVEGAVGLVQQAVLDLHEKGVVQLDAAQRARLVTNLMTVLVSEGDTTPVVPLSA
jgi:regulator of protease activity HflC (stomatin/prohibitin superfamily)